MQIANYVKVVNVFECYIIGLMSFIDGHWVLSTVIECYG